MSVDEWQGSLAAMIANTERNLQGFNKDNQMSQFNAMHALTRMEATYDKVSRRSPPSARIFTSRCNRPRRNCVKYMACVLIVNFASKRKTLRPCQTNRNVSAQTR